MTNVPSTSFSCPRTPFDSRPENPHDALLVEYLERLENGETVSPESVLGEYPELGASPHLLESLRSVWWLHQAGQELGHAPDLSLHASSESGFDNSDALIEQLVGKTFGDYRLIREIGRGGMGVVFEAEQVSLSRVVAVKVLPPAAMWDQRHIARFLVESQVAAQLTHPNIVPIYAVGSLESTYYFSMPLIDCCAFRAPQDPTTLARRMVPVASAIHHAHEMGIIHRDIKPSNLLLDRSGKLWVADFGLARWHTSASVTATGAVVGTLRYMSPEQAQGSHQLVDHRTDIYALGVSMYELLTGRCPYDAEDRVAFLREVERGEPELPSRLRADIPVDLETIILKAMSRFPDQRYESAKALGDDLERFIAGEVILAKRPSQFDRIDKWIRRNHRTARVLAATWLLVSLFVFAGLLVLINSVRTTNLALEQSQQSAKEADVFFHQAREVVDHLALKVAPELSSVPEAAPIRNQLLRDTLSYYQAFAQQIAENPSRQQELANTLIDIATIASQLGAREESITAYRHALDVLMQCNGDDRQIGLAWNNLANEYRVIGNHVEASGALKQAIEHLENSLAEAPASRPLRRMQALARAASGDTAVSIGHRATGLHSLELAEETLCQLIDSCTDSEEKLQLSQDRLVTLGFLISAHRALSPQRAFDCSRQATEIAEQMMGVSLVGQHQRQAVLPLVATTFHNHAAILSDASHYERSLEAFERALNIRLDLHHARPSSPRLALEIANTYSEIANVCAMVQRDDEQIQAFNSAMAVLRNALVRHTENAELRTALATAAYNLGLVTQEDSYASVHKRAYQQFSQQLTWLRDRYGTTPLWDEMHFNWRQRGEVHRIQ